MLHLPQADGAYVDQIPAGAHAPRAAPSVQPPLPGREPAGLYLQVATAADQTAAVKASLDLLARAGGERPPFVRGVVAQQRGVRTIVMYAGPFASEADAQAFCARALPMGSPCLLQPLPAGRGAP